MRAPEPQPERIAGTPAPLPSGCGGNLRKTQRAHGPELRWPRTHLQVVGREDRPPPRTPDVLLHLPQRPETLPAAAPVFVQLLQQHPLGLQEAQLPVVVRTGQQGESKGLEGKTAGH